MLKVKSEFELHNVLGLAPVADAFAGTVYSDIVKLDNSAWVTFYVLKGAEATGTTLITVQPCSNASAGATGAGVAFNYRVCTSGDTWGAITAATSAGFTTTAGAAQMYAIEVDPDVVQETDGYNWVRLKMVEQANDPCTGAILIQHSNLRYAKDIDDTSIA